jgi:hypothetical protein
VKPEKNSILYPKKWRRKKSFLSFFTKFMIQNMNDRNYQIILDRTNAVHRMVWQTTISSGFLLYVLARRDQHLEDVKT